MSLTCKCVLLYVNEQVDLLNVSQSKDFTHQEQSGFMTWSFGTNGMQFKT